METNILSAGAAELTALKDRVVKLEQEKAHNEDLLKRSAALQKEIEKKKKAMSDEMDNTLKQRKESIEKNFDDQIATINKEIKKVKADRQKEKENLVSDKVVSETADLREEVKTLKHDIKAKISEQKLPLVTRNWIFYALFMPKSAGEVIFAIFFFIFAFALLPVGISALLGGFPEGDTWILAVVYIVDVLIFVGAYVLINNLVKDKHREALTDIIDLRTRIRIKNREIKLVKRGIERDTDESSYNLEAFDTALHTKEDGIKRLETERKGALNDYNNNIKPALIEEIQGRHQPDIDALKKQVDDLQTEQRKVSDFIKEENIELAKNYEPFVGKANMNEAALDRLIAAINDGRASTVGEAVALPPEEKTKSDNQQK